MHISEGLENFIHNALLKSKRDRILGFLTKEKNHKKFSSALDHDFEKYLDTTKFVSKLSESELEQVGNLYCSNGVTNNSESPMVNLYGKAPWEGGWLLINKMGTLGIYRPEGRVDDEIHIKL
jgi:hypothetical protein